MDLALVRGEVVKFSDNIIRKLMMILHKCLCLSILFIFFFVSLFTISTFIFVVLASSFSAF